MREYRSGGPSPGRCAVTRATVGYLYFIQYALSNYEYLTRQRYGWRPTKRWAARACAHKVMRYTRNWEARKGTNPQETDPFEILNGRISDDEVTDRKVSRTKKDLKKIAEELST